MQIKKITKLFFIFIATLILFNSKLVVFNFNVHAQEDVTCNDEFGEHQVDDTWTGSCSVNSGKIVKFACDSTGTITKVGEVDDPACGQQTQPPGQSAGNADVKKVFGIIQAPTAIQPFLQAGGNGAGGISLFINNAIQLIYIAASIVFVFMIVISAFEWITSGGDKTKLESAQKRLTNAIIGIVLFALAFAIIKVVGIFTGFTFFNSVTQPGGICTQREEYYFDPKTAQCIHKIFSGANCTAVFTPVEYRFCQIPSNP